MLLLLGVSRAALNQRKNNNVGTLSRVKTTAAINHNQQFTIFDLLLIFFSELVLNLARLGYT